MRHIKSGTFIAALLLTTVIAVSSVAGRESKGRGADPLKRINHIVVIYEENHSFDNLYGSWEGVRGLNDADAAHTAQVDQNGNAYSCLLQNDVNLAPLGCNAFANTWWTIDNYFPPSDTTCPTILGAFNFPFGVPRGTGLPGGCT